MKALALSFFALAAYSGFPTSWPEFGFRYISGVTRDTFEFDKSQSPLFEHHFWWAIKDTRLSGAIQLRGDDLCYLADAAASRVVDARGSAAASPVLTSVSADVIATAAENINTALTDQNGDYIWFTRGNLGPTIVYNPPSESASALAWARSCVGYYYSFRDLADASLQDVTASTGSLVDRERMRHLFRALYRMRFFGVNAEPRQVSAVFSFIKEVDDQDTPDATIAWNVVYTHESRIGVSFSYDYGTQWESRWQVKQTRNHNAWASPNREGSFYSRGGKPYAVLKIERGRRNWATGSISNSTTYMIYSYDNWSVNDSVQEILSLAGIVDDISCPQKTDELKRAIEMSAAPGAVGAFWNDYTTIRVLGCMYLCVVSLSPGFNDFYNL